MSGFIAIRSDTQPVPKELVQAMEARGLNRGVARRWEDEGVVLVGFEGFRGHPLAIADDYVVVLDSRIDNRKDLTAGLGSDAPPPDATEAELVLRCWRRWGDRCLSRIIGDFAGAVWDRRRRGLVVFHDLMGARPALTARSKGRVIAASQIHMILADPELDRTIDDMFVAPFIAASQGFATATGYRAIRRLRPNHLAVANTGRRWEEREWYRWDPRPVRESSDEAYADRFRELFDEAVRCRVRGVDRAGVSLSGGLDSTSIAVTLPHVASLAEIVGFSIGFEDEIGDERPLQRLAAEKAGARQEWVSLEGRNAFGDSFDETLDRFGVPLFAANWFQSDAVADAVDHDGVKVVLDGIDGDGVLQGSMTFASDLLVTGRWRTLRRELKATQRVHGVKLAFLIVRHVIRPLLPTRIWIAWRKLRGREVVPPSVDLKFAGRVGLGRMIFDQPWRPGGNFQARERHVTRAGVIPATLEMLDEIYGARGIELAHPFLDRRLVEYCLGLPRTQKIRNGWTKTILRHAMAGRLPEEIRTRPDKANLSRPFTAFVLNEKNMILREGLSIAGSNLVSWSNRERYPEAHRESGCGGGLLGLSAGSPGSLGGSVAKRGRSEFRSYSVRTRRFVRSYLEEGSDQDGRGYSFRPVRPNLTLCSGRGEVDV